MDYHGFLGYASDKMVNFAIETLRRSDSPLDLNLSRSLDLYGKNPDFYGTNADPSIVFSYSPPPLPRVVLEQTLVQLDAETKSKGPSIDPAILPTLRKGVVTISSFISLLLKELRELICGKGKNPKKLGPQWHALLSH